MSSVVKRPCREDMSSLWKNYFRTRQREADPVYEVLKGIPIFEDLDRRGLAQIKRILHQREYRRDEVIFHQGDPGLGMYIIEDGTVGIICEPGGECLAELQSGDFFGELSLLDDSPRGATAIARTHSRMLCFFQPDLFDLMDRNPRLGVKILFRLARTVGERLKRTNDQISELKRGA